MSAGMAEAIAAHPGHEIRLDHDSFVMVCFGCPWRHRYSDSSGLEAHAVHVAEELTKAGYGNVQEAKAEALTDAAEVFGAGTWNNVYIMADVEDDADAARATADWLRERAAALTPNPLAAALADPEGHALVKAIHDRKAEASRS